ncbi:hypothetical protein FGG08_005491 [Glutinoglossum americanum]|uniref:Sterol regulatory element-binding protein cleavage-activating protein n=1 Tax=Glutinoglossum americanum TaxID=1670608 RepID=A0A9P8I2U7_9PEZI|nr:hypothetical protein FGG08_005491 [Glutinoglossum americanum]
MAAQRDPISSGLGRLWRIAANAVSSCCITDPPVLDKLHPMRKFLSRHASFVARRPALFIIASVAVGTAFSYFFALLYAFGPSGASVLLGRGPGEWTASAVRPVEGGGEAAIVVEMRQAWVYGSSMRALDKDVLGEGLKVQNMLLGDTVGCTLSGSAGLSVGAAESGSRMLFHSPLIYWNCSSSSLYADPDVTSTISHNSHSFSPFNPTLRPSSVLGNIKKSANGTIVAADALIISLIYPQGSKRAENTWLRGVQALAGTGRYRMYPSIGREVTTIPSKLYEFRSLPAATPASSTALALAYCIIVVYALSHLGKARTLKSRLGLAVAVVTQICVSILAASIIVPLLNHRGDSRRPGDSRIPREAYPLMVLVVGLENTCPNVLSIESRFRLIKAVPEASNGSPTSRIAKALGDVGHITLISVVQNLIFLYFLPKVAYPEVADFWMFVAVAIIFDLILHFTFFIAALSLDLRRLELEDSLDRGISTSSRSSKPMKGSVSLNGHVGAKPRWGNGPSLLASAFRVLTLGTFAMVCFVMALNWHLASKETSLSERRSVELTPPARATEPAAAFMGSILQSEEPAAWLESQDSDTIKDFVRATGLQSQRFVGKVHDPLIIVSKNANRTPPVDDISSLLPFPSPGLQLLASHHRRLMLYIALTSVIAGLLVKHLLHGTATGETSDTRHVRKSQIAVQTLGRGHSVDIVMLAASPKGVLASVGLDRRILVWHLRGGQLAVESVTRVSLDNNMRMLWPVAAIALDDQAEWLAICPQAGIVSFWNLNSKQFGKSAPIKCSPSEGPISFFFMPRSPSDSNAHFVLIRKSGLMTEVEVSGKSDTVAAVEIEHQISPAGTASLSSSLPVHSSRMPLRLVSTIKDGGMYVTTKRGGRVWASERISWPKAVLPAEIQDMEFVPVKALGIMGLMRSSASPDVHLLDVQLPVSSFSIAYTSHETNEFIMHTFTPNATQIERGYPICLRAERDSREKRCAGFEKVTEKVSRIDVSGGAWESTLFNSVAGIRKRVAPGTRNRPRSGESGSGYYRGSLGSYGIVRRKSNNGSGNGQHRRSSSPPSEDKDEDDEWEAWTMPSTGEVATCPLSEPPSSTPDESAASGSLLVSRAGPACAVGGKSVAVAFGATIKVVLLGTEHYDDVGDDDGYALQPTAGRRPLATRKPHGGARFVK